jgi:hypothetical protein
MLCFVKVVIRVRARLGQGLYLKAIEVISPYNLSKNQSKKLTAKI